MQTTQTILEALSKWRSPGGAAVRSILVDVDEKTGAHAIAIDLRAPGGIVPVSVALSYAEAMTLPAATIAYRLAEASAAAWRRRDEPEAAPHAHPKEHAPTAPSAT